MCTGKGLEESSELLGAVLYRDSVTRVSIIDETHLAEEAASPQVCKQALLAIAAAHKYSAMSCSPCM